MSFRGGFLKNVYSHVFLGRKTVLGIRSPDKPTSEMMWHETSGVCAENESTSSQLIPVEYHEHGIRHCPCVFRVLLLCLGGGLPLHTKQTLEIQNIRDKGTLQNGHLAAHIPHRFESMSHGFGKLPFGHNAS